MLVAQHPQLEIGSLTFHVEAAHHACLLCTVACIYDTSVLIELACGKERSEVSVQVGGVNLYDGAVCQAVSTTHKHSAVSAYAHGLQVIPAALVCKEAELGVQTALEAGLTVLVHYLLEVRIEGIER